MPKNRPTRGERGDPGWNPPRKKKNTAKTRPTAGKGCMREGYTQTVTESQHAPAVGRTRPGGEQGGSHALSFGVIFDIFLVKNALKN